jgi:hypothetical protein
VKGRVLNIKINGEISRVEEENDALVELAATDLRNIDTGDLVLAVLERQWDGGFRGVPAAGLYKIEKDIIFKVGGKDYGMFRRRR